MNFVQMAYFNRLPWNRKPKASSKASLFIKMSIATQVPLTYHLSDLSKEFLLGSEMYLHVGFQVYKFSTNHNVINIFAAEPCNTSPVGPDEDPLLCPYGYVCHVDDSHDHKKRRKNSGQGYCIKQTNDLG